MARTALNINIGDKALITTDNWFIAPDGKQYRAVFGRVKSVKTDGETLGVTTNRHSTNWYVEIGNMVVAGCQIHYAIQCEKCNLRPVKERVNGEPPETRDSSIYDAGE